MGNNDSSLKGTSSSVKESELLEETQNTIMQHFQFSQVNGNLFMEGTDIKQEEIKELLANQNAQKILLETFSEKFGESIDRKAQNEREQNLNSRQMGILRELLKEEEIFGTAQGGNDLFQSFKHIKESLCSSELQNSQIAKTQDPGQINRNKDLEPRTQYLANQMTSERFKMNFNYLRGRGEEENSLRDQYYKDRKQPNSQELKSGQDSFLFSNVASYDYAFKRHKSEVGPQSPLNGDPSISCLENEEYSYKSQTSLDLRSRISSVTAKQENQDKSYSRSEIQTEGDNENLYTLKMEEQIQIESVIQQPLRSKPCPQAPSFKLNSQQYPLSKEGKPSYKLNSNIKVLPVVNSETVKNPIKKIRSLSSGIKIEKGNYNSFQQQSQPKLDMSQQSSIQKCYTSLKSFPEDLPSENIRSQKSDYLNVHSSFENKFRKLRSTSFETQVKCKSQDYFHSKSDTNTSEHNFLQKSENNVMPPLKPPRPARYDLSQTEMQNEQKSYQLSSRDEKTIFQDTSQEVASSSVGAQFENKNDNYFSQYLKIVTEEEENNNKMTQCKSNFGMNSSFRVAPPQGLCSLFEMNKLITEPKNNNDLQASVLFNFAKKNYYTDNETKPSKEDTGTEPVPDIQYQGIQCSFSNHINKSQDSSKNETQKEKSTSSSRSQPYNTLPQANYSMKIIKGIRKSRESSVDGPCTKLNYEGDIKKSQNQFSESVFPPKAISMIKSEELLTKNDNTNSFFQNIKDELQILSEGFKQLSQQASTYVHPSENRIISSVNDRQSINNLQTAFVNHKDNYTELQLVPIFHQNSSTSLLSPKAVESSQRQSQENRDREMLQFKSYPKRDNSDHPEIPVFSSELSGKKEVNMEYTPEKIIEYQESKFHQVVCCEAAPISYRGSYSGSGYKRLDLKLNESIDFNKEEGDNVQVFQKPVDIQERPSSSDSQEKILKIISKMKKNSSQKNLTCSNTKLDEEPIQQNAAFSSQNPLIQISGNLKSNSQEQIFNTLSNDSKCQVDLTAQFEYLKSRSRNFDCSITGEIKTLEGKLSSLFDQIRSKSICKFSETTLEDKSLNLNQINNDYQQKRRENYPENPFAEEKEEFNLANNGSTLNRDQNQKILDNFPLTSQISSNTLQMQYSHCDYHEDNYKITEEGTNIYQFNENYINYGIEEGEVEVEKEEEQCESDFQQPQNINVLEHPQHNLQLAVEEYFTLNKKDEQEEQSYSLHGQHKYQEDEDVDWVEKQVQENCEMAQNQLFRSESITSSYLSNKPKFQMQQQSHEMNHMQDFEILKIMHMLDENTNDVGQNLKQFQIVSTPQSGIPKRNSLQQLKYQFEIANTSQSINVSKLKNNKENDLSDHFGQLSSQSLQKSQPAPINLQENFFNNSNSSCNNKNNNIGHSLLQISSSYPEEIYALQNSDSQRKHTNRLPELQTQLSNTKLQKRNKSLQVLQEQQINIQLDFNTPVVSLVSETNQSDQKMNSHLNCENYMSETPLDEYTLNHNFYIQYNKQDEQQYYQDTNDQMLMLKYQQDEMVSFNNNNNSNRKYDLIKNNHQQKHKNQYIHQLINPREILKDKTSLERKRQSNNCLQLNINNGESKLEKRQATHQKVTELYSQYKQTILRENKTGQIKILPKGELKKKSPHNLKISSSSSSSLIQKNPKQIGKKQNAIINLERSSNLDQAGIDKTAHSKERSNHPLENIIKQSNTTQKMTVTKAHSLSNRQK